MLCHGDGAALLRGLRNLHYDKLLGDLTISVLAVLIVLLFYAMVTVQHYYEDYAILDYDKLLEHPGISQLAEDHIAANAKVSMWPCQC